MTNMFKAIRNNIVRDINMNWTAERKQAAYEQLEGGKAILTTSDQLDRYIFSFGNMHEAKLNVAISTISDLDKINAESVEIIDYGCGQGIGSIVLLDHLPSNVAIDNVVLIEPSVTCTNRASEYVTQINSEATIRVINKKISELAISDIESNAASVKFHMFSNILDVNDFDLKSLHRTIMNSQNGLNYFICVSPDYYSGNLRLDEFTELFSVEPNFSLISDRCGEITNPNNQAKTWKHYEKVFEVVI